MAPRSAVLYLDVDDEITSAAARIRASEATRVAIVVPPGSRIATSRINFRLLAREALERNRRLSIVAPDAASRALAASAGLPVFLSVGEFESAQAEAGRPAGAEDAAGPGLADEAPDAPATDGSAGGAGNETLAIAAAGAASAGGAGAGGAGALARGVEATALARGVETAAAPARPHGGSLPVVGRRPFRLDGRRAGAAALVVALAVLVLAVAGYVLLPSATIVVRPRVDAIGPFTFDVRADPSATGVDATALVIPAQRVEFPLSVTDTFPATGRRTQTTRATGTVTFQNCDTGRPHTIPSGSVVSTDGGIGFATTAGVTLSRAQLVGIPPFQSVQCSTASTGVSAVKAGPDGNVAAGAIDVMPPGFDLSVLHVANSDPTTGGTSQDFPKITQKDVDSALTALTRRLSDAFDAQVADPAKAPEGTTVFPETATLGPVTPTSDPKALVNKEQDSFSLTLTATGTALAVDESPLQDLANQKLRATIDADHALVANSVSVQVGTPAAGAEGVSFPVSVSASEIQRLDADEIRSEVKGRSLVEARSILAAYGDASVSVWPDWVSSIPTLDARVSVRVETTVPVEPSGSGSPGGPAGGSPGGSSGAPSGSSGGPGASAAGTGAGASPGSPAAASP